MTIFKEKIEEEHLTIPEVKELLAEVEAERAADEEREMRYELARAIEHVNRFSELSANDSRALVEELQDHEKVETVTAFKIVDLLPQTRDELRAVYAQERYSLSGEELDEILNVVARYV